MGPGEGGIRLQPGSQVSERASWIFYGKLTSHLLQSTKHPTQQAENLCPAFPEAWLRFMALPRMPECSKECRVSFTNAHPHLALGCMEPISWPGTPSVTTETYGVPNSPRCTRLHSLPNYSLHQVPLLSYPRRLLRVYTWGAGCFYSEPLGCKTFLFQKMLPGNWEKRKASAKAHSAFVFL